MKSKQSKFTKAILFFIFCFPILIFAQQTIEGNIEYDGLDRTFILYIPASYSDSEPVPLVFNFHGYTSDAMSQMFYGDFRSIADTANFIIVHPMGTIGADGQTFFNAEWGAEVDDIGFSGALIDYVVDNYSINTDRIYSTGMSNGGFMSYTLACNLSDRFAAIASVTGSMTSIQQSNTCQPNRPIPVLEIHGTNDDVVPYNGNNWMAPIDDVILFWVDHNQCEEIPSVTSIEDTDMTDNSTVEKYLYNNGDQGTTVELMKITGGGHTWPGSIFNVAGTNQDINASTEVWRFFSQFDLNGLISTNDDIKNPYPLVSVFPNPSTSGDFNIISEKAIQSIKIFNIDGTMIHTIPFKNQNIKSYNFELRKGVYLIKVQSNSQIQTIKLVSTY